MTLQKREQNPIVTVAIITGVFGIITAIIGGCFLISNTMVENRIKSETNIPFIALTSQTTETPVPAFTNSVLISVATEIPTIIPTPTKISINTFNRFGILSLFEIPRNTNRSDVDRSDTVFRPSLPVDCLVIIPNYPLLPQYTLDDYGHLYENGQSSLLSPPLGEILNVDIGKWENYLGVFNFVIPTDKNLQFYGLYIRSEGGGLNWQDSQRFVYSADVLNGFEIERASYVEIQDCSDTPNNDWAKENARSAAASSTNDSVYYWDKLLNTWVQVIK